ncbi:conserved hypothetical protein [Rippkaea orientalis PCC 8801]|uniref:Uncharacterized protein n=1 Tax=Rippkaea orientalis (strain PCC 8801 / RF-1) TaxID=41431 RepID=B7JXI4_RIPO1|nr:hypothetical protein [Rippkaea orientalis]ACK64741.1 conserved hypothetical protein [Rippkaea orientalis PCC 8801]
MDKEAQNYRMVCTLTFGDVYGQIIVWLIVIFLTLASALGLWSSTRQIYALAVVGLVLVLSLPFLVFAFVTTLLNHIEFTPIEASQTTRSTSRRSVKPATQQTAEATS